MQRILIVDDDTHLRKLVLTYAEIEGYICDEAENGNDALGMMRSKSYDLILLDVMMPGIDGFETLTEIRKFYETPVIMLTSRTEEYDKLFGFNLGADDYIAKPFSPKELMARSKAVLRRTSNLNHSGEIRFGDLCITPDARVVALNGVTLNLTPKEYDLLIKFAQNEGIVLSREQLLETVWGYSYHGDARTVDTHIKSLRDRLGTYRKIIRTVWGVGYKFEYKD